MADVDIDTALEWRGRTVIDRDGEKLGTLKEIYLDQHERPHWGSIATGLFGTRETLAPLTAAQLTGDGLQLPYAGDHVRAAPNVEPDVQLSADEEQLLHRHYEIRDSSQPPEDDDAMTRSEEEVTFRKQQRPRERVRLKKYVVTDYVKKRVPVQREKVRLEHEPPDPDSARQD
jgi:Domain of unknown function (DUF2382)/PRC-barrel domain